MASVQTPVVGVDAMLPPPANPQHQQAAALATALDLGPAALGTAPTAPGLVLTALWLFQAAPVQQAGPVQHRHLLSH